MKKYYLSFAAMLSITCLWAQDQHFTQFYAIPTNVNPAFAGASVQSRLGLQYRKQWMAIPGAFSAANLSYDQYFPLIKSGFGALINHEEAGSGSLRSTSIAVQYAYEARIQRNWFLRPAFQFGYVTKNVDFEKMIFYDQMIREGDVPTLESPVNVPVNFFDFGGGLLTYGPKFWLGISAYHVNNPNESFYSDNQLPRPYRGSVHAGMRVRLKGNAISKLDHHMVFAANYLTQTNFDQLDFGWYYEFSPVVLGLWYRGIPVKSNGYGTPNHDAISVLVGAQAARYKIGYSYDITISQLGISSSAGSHEISIVYTWSNKHNERTRKIRIMPCVEF